MTTARYSDLHGASVFITGGGSGIGAALTRGFLDQGARVAFVGRSDYRAFARDLGKATGNTPLFIRCDVTETGALHAAMEKAAKAHDGLQVLVNNAANDLRTPATEVTTEQWEDLMAVNLRHYFFACQKAALLMHEGGSIINFSSLSYLFGSAGMAPYVAANAGIMGLTRSLAREWGGHGLRVNAIAPGWVLTDKQLDKWATPEALEHHLRLQCLKRHLVPEDIVGPTLFLASNASAMMTSQVIAVDGGVAMTG